MKMWTASAQSENSSLGRAVLQNRREVHVTRSDEVAYFQVTGMERLVAHDSLCGVGCASRALRKVFQAGPVKAIADQGGVPSMMRRPL